MCIGHESFLNPTMCLWFTTKQAWFGYWQNKTSATVNFKTKFRRYYRIELIREVCIVWMCVWWSEPRLKEMSVCLSVCDDDTFDNAWRVSAQTKHVPKKGRGSHSCSTHSLSLTWVLHSQHKTSPYAPQEIVTRDLQHLVNPHPRMFKLYAAQNAWGNHGCRRVSPCPPITISSFSVCRIAK